MDINEYSLKLIADDCFLKKEYNKFIREGYSIKDIYGILDCNSLHSFLKAAEKKKKLRKMLPELLWHVNWQSISNENFEILLHLKAKDRANCFFVLGHHNLSYYQMQILNRYSDYEPFAWLFDKICQYDCFTENDMRQILSDNRGVTKYAIQCCIEDARKAYGDSEKINVAEEWTGDGSVS